MFFFTISFLSQKMTDSVRFSTKYFSYSDEKYTICGAEDAFKTHSKGVEDRRNC